MAAQVWLRAQMAEDIQLGGHAIVDSHTMQRCQHSLRAGPAMACQCMCRLALE